MGRPPGAPGGNRRRGYPQDWELRDPARFGERLHELESDEDDGQGVILDPNNFALRERRQRGYAGDALYFDGHDLGQDRGNRRGVYDEAYDDYISEEEEYYRDQQRNAAYQNAGRGQAEPLIQSAMDRIARAREKGKTNVNLTLEEMDALQRRSSQPLEPSSTLASPPATPNKSKVKASSRNTSSTSLAGQKKGKKSSSSFFGSPAKSNSKAKMSRKNSVDQTAAPYPPGGGQLPPYMVPGPNGVPVYAPYPYYAPPSPEFARRSPSGGASRSSSKQSRRESTPPEQYQGLPPRYYSGAPRPDSREGSGRPHPDDLDYYPPPPLRTRSASNAQHPGYRYPDDYDMAPPGPAAQGRRHVSGPPDVRYASLRRVPPSSSPLATRAQPAGSTLRRVETSSSSSSDDQGVQVDIVPDENGGYSIRSVENPAPAPTPAPVPTSSKNEARKRKSGRR